MEQIEDQLNYLIDLMSRGALRAPDHELVVLRGTDLEVQEQVNQIFQRMDEADQSQKPGQKKFLLSWDWTLNLIL